jgi:hypothetical protein
MLQLHSSFLRCLRVLTWRASREDFAAFSSNDLKVGLLLTWLVGMGRWWDDPRAGILQHLGVGSVVYVFVLSAILWAVVLPLKPARWSYLHVLTFVSFTAPPAILYAIPVERFFDLDTAGMMNVAFLATVALWRVALLLRYLLRHARLPIFEALVASLIPLMGVVVSLVALNLEHVVFDIMGGIREGSESANDASYSILFVLSMLSFFGFIPVLLGYGLCIWKARGAKRE